MNRAENGVAEVFGCNELEARELAKTGQAVAQQCIKVYDNFSLDTLIATKRIIDKVSSRESERRKDKVPNYGFEATDKRLEASIKANRRAMSGPAKKMWQTYQATADAEEQFRLALQPVPSLGHGVDGALTLVWEQLHQAHQLTQPVKVGEGRIAYQTLRRQDWLVKQLGLSDIYYGYQHSYRPPRW